MKVVFVPGDGVGAEVAWAARKAVEAAGARIDWVPAAAGLAAFERHGDPLPAATVAAAREAGLVLRGPLDSCAGGRGRNPAAALDEALQVFASVRRCRALLRRGLPADGMDLLVIAQVERRGRAAPEASAALSPESREGLSPERVEGPADAVAFFEFAFGRALKAGRRRVTLAHRGSADAEWIRAATAASRRRPELEFEDQLAGHVAMQLARSPHRFDAIVAEPVHGEILGDLAVGLAGGLGWVPAARHGARGAMFTTVHGTAAKLAGTGRVNPSAMVLAGAEMLDFAGESRGAEAVVAALTRSLAGGPVVFSSGT